MKAEITKIAVLGAGESGIGAALLAKKLGKDVFVSDFGNIKPKYEAELINHNVEYEQNQHTESRLLEANLIIKSPGIPDDTKIILKLKKKNKRLISEIEFAAANTEGILIGITGSNGKTTTASLVYHILQNAKLNVSLCGNIGNSFARQVASKDTNYYVLELSSFQLDYMFDTKLDIAVLLNIVHDHLDRYENIFENYVFSKFRIFQNQKATDHFVYCSDDSVITTYLKTIKTSSKEHLFTIYQNEEMEGYVDENQKIIIKTNKKKQLVMNAQQLPLKGKHNIYNTLAAGIIGQILDLKNDEIRKSLSDFKNISHRLEFVAKINDVKFINDSKATNVNATWYALESMNNSVIWLVGGVDKGNDYDMLRELVEDKVKIIVCIGKDNEKIKTSFKKSNINLFEVKDMKEAISTSYEMSMPGDSVLLSPACASFDKFKNYEDRGNQFIEAVKAL